MNQFFTIKKREQVVYVQMDLPNKLNIIGSEAIDSLHRVIEGLASEPDLRVVVLSGTERAFVGGADIKEMRELDPASARVFISKLHECLSAIRHLPIPVIAAIRGYALGAGCELAAACDIRIAGETAVFGMPEIKVGIPSVIEGALLVPLIGLSRAAHLVLTGELLSAQEAERIGLVSKIVPNDEVEQEALRLAEEIAGFSPQAVKLQKELVHQWQNTGMEQAMTNSIEAFSRAFTTTEPREAMSAFFEKRKPHF